MTSQRSKTMEYFTLLHLQREPFSNSPDPEMFFHSTQHQGCLQKLELSIRLKRGLSVVIGEIGTGKSTLCRQLIQRISRANSQIVPHLILDPEFSTPLEFLTIIAKAFGLDCPAAEGLSAWGLKDAIKNHLFEQAMQHQKVPVLILDEGQKLPGFGVEILREFLNFETNQHKLLQIVIFAQEEFLPVLKQKANFADRIASRHYLRPLNFQDTRAMIAFRLSRAHTEPGPPPALFSQAAILAIYWLTRGYPRRIVMLCSKVMIAILVHHQKQAGVLLVLSAAREGAGKAPAGRGRRFRMATAIVTIGMALFLLPVAGKNSGSIVSAPTPPQPPVLVKSTPPRIEPPKPTSPPKVPPVTSPVVPVAAVREVPALLPANLGSLEIDRGVSLSKMVARIYGRYTPKNMALVLQANPQITDPDQVAPKTMVTFPVLPKRGVNDPPERVRLQLTEVTSLASAYAVVKEYSEAAPPLLIIPSPAAAGKGIDFHVVLEETFADENVARARIKDLAPEFQSQAQLKKSGDFQGQGNSL